MPRDACLSSKSMMTAHRIQEWKLEHVAGEVEGNHQTLINGHAEYTVRASHDWLLEREGTSSRCLVCLDPKAGAELTPIGSSPALLLGPAVTLTIRAISRG
ncbi:hypothetical protein JDV02_003106 [Purpureocillium takamizusanense]|uniref:Uncharacterized protein n=1 Tax=Purpureocillium takamizusanense TaxID=2060973 RepID=A0A9Q8QCF7_9HYPO|nr:uncharacterized protein JDV02_003106 [Purpureocillium takamizusanense]UNI16692.1 hypothetical protein JDV02_003106 [Purpureocillium takamizusanense]